MWVVSLAFAWPRPYAWSVAKSLAFSLARSFAFDDVLTSTRI